MNVLRITQSQSLTNRILTNKKLLRSLEKLSEHGTSFSATTSLLMTIGVRPLMISMTPNVEKENKQYAMSNSICSGLIKFGMLEAVTLPLELAVKRIDDNPDQFLNNFTIIMLIVRFCTLIYNKFHLLNIVIQHFNIIKFLFYTTNNKWYSVR